ncbi:GLPGLI family protein [Chitinophaga sp. XS-30]|uniref:GLPGLI family protein n=1 Tax=Chitinophaga sp. XS-30 TaxID=2604421 RepID=UPI0011DC745E|nr:GLPGLI family protein [Chitinophaga sp. XS-30]QEH42011.1 GLPGLI family protein [Chitinophaga sp. XS-30]
MKFDKLFIIIPVLIVGGVFAVLMSNKVPDPKVASTRFFYELKYKPNLSSDSLASVLTVLDVVSGSQSVYRDYTVLAQDSILKAQMETMRKTGVFVQMEKLIKMPKFGYRILKKYPLAASNSIQFIDGIERKLFAYEEKLKFDWKIQPDTATISTYKTQKATMNFGGRTWTAWFTPDIPFQDGPYKFCGLPGLIVKLQDGEENYSWTLVGNKNIENYTFITYADQLYYGNNVTPKLISRKRFMTTYQEYKKEPFASIKAQLTKEELNNKIPGSNLTQGDMIASQERVMKEFFSFNNNPIEKN